MNTKLLEDKPIKSPLRYPGGKFYAVKYIMPYLFSKKFDEYREPFVGGGSVFFQLPTNINRWINDINTDIYEFYSFIVNESNVKCLIKMLENEVATKERHNEVKLMQPNNILEKVFKTFYLNRTSYSGIINKPAWGYKDGKSSPPPNWGKFILNASEKLKSTRITNYDFSDVILEKTNKNVMLYLDPPYFEADQKRAYTNSFKHNDHLRLAKILKSTDKNFCLSYDNCTGVRDLYSWANIYEEEWLYNTANIAGSARKIGKELVITNFKVCNLKQ